MGWLLLLLLLLLLKAAAALLAALLLASAAWAECAREAPRPLLLLAWERAEGRASLPAGPPALPSLEVSRLTVTEWCG